jgi:glycosyltransferase involved in cell wall biosynthesis
VNNEPLSNRAAILAGKILGIPVICHVRGHEKRSPMIRFLYRLPDHFIPVSEWIWRGIQTLGLPDAKGTVVYDGIALEDLDLSADGAAFRKSFGIPQDAFTVGLVGVLIPWKGQHLFLDAAKELAKGIPSLRMLIIGGTPDECIPYEKELKLRVRKEGLDKIVIFTGHMNNMCPIYNGLDVVVSASTSPEPLGTVVIECMAMGRPLVAPNHGGAAEMTEDGVSALLFEPGDVHSLARSIGSLYHQSGLAAQLGKAARENALRMFAIGGHVNSVQAIYERVLLHNVAGTAVKSSSLLSISKSVQ